MAAVWLALDVYPELKGHRVTQVQARTDSVHQAHKGHLNCRCSSLVHCDTCYLFFFLPTRRQWATANGEIKVPSGENPVLTNVLPLKPGVATTVSSDVGFVFGRRRCCCCCCLVCFSGLLFTFARWHLEDCNAPPWGVDRLPLLKCESSVLRSIFGKHLFVDSNMRTSTRNLGLASSLLECSQLF